MMSKKEILSLAGLVPGRPANGEKMYASIPKNNFTRYGKDYFTKEGEVNQIEKQRQNIKNLMDATHKEAPNNQLYKGESNLLGSRKLLKYRVSSEDVNKPQENYSDEESLDSDVSITSLHEDDFKKKNHHDFKHLLQKRPGRKKSLSCSNIRDFVKLEKPFEEYNDCHKKGKNPLPNIIVQEPDKKDHGFDQLDNYETAEFEKVRKRSVSADNIPVAVEDYEEEEKVCELPSIFLSPNLRHVKPSYVQKVEVRTRKLSKSAPNIPKQVQNARRPTPMFDESASKNIKFKTKFSSSLTDLKEVGTEGFDNLETRSEGGDLDSWPLSSSEVEEEPDPSASLSSSLPSSMMEKLHQRRLDARRHGKRAQKYVV